MPIFVGIDLAWTAHREDVPYESGICVLESKDNVDIRCSRLKAVRMHINDIVKWLEELANESSPVMVAIDAPLIVTPKRNAEKKLNKEFSEYNAGAYMPSMKWLERCNTKAGPLIGEELKRNFNLDPKYLLRGDTDEFIAIEVYPHPIHVRLFDLENRIPYKKGAKKRNERACYVTKIICVITLRSTLLPLWNTSIFNMRLRPRRFRITCPEPPGRDYP